MYHVETSLTFDGKLLGYTIDVQRGGYCITMDSTEVLLMYKPYLQVENDCVEEYERLALHHIYAIAGTERSSFRVDEEKQHKLVLTNLLAELYLCYFSTSEYTNIFGETKSIMVRHNLDVLFFYEVLAGDRKLLVSGDHGVDDFYGIPEYFYIRVAIMYLDRVRDTVSADDVKCIVKEVEEKCVHYEVCGEREAFFKQVSDLFKESRWTK